MVEEAFVRCLQRAILGAQHHKLTVEASDLGNGLIFANNRCPGDKAMPSKDLFYVGNVAIFVILAKPLMLTRTLIGCEMKRLKELNHPGMGKGNFKKYKEK